MLAVICMVVRAYAAILKINVAAGAGALPVASTAFGREWLRTENQVADRCRLVRVRDESPQPNASRQCRS